MKLVNRNDKVMYYGVVDVTNGDVVYKRMQGFTDLAKSHNAQEYSRRYVDEKNERTDVTGYAPSISFGFDQMSDLDVHQDLSSIIDGESIGTDAVRSLILVDMTSENSGTYTGYKRNFSIIPSSEGDGTDAYTFSGEFRSNGETEIVTGTLSDNDLVFTVTP